MSTKLDEKTAKFISEQDGKITVDWQGLSDSKKSASSALEINASRQIEKNLFEYLFDRGVLTHQNSIGSYFLADRDSRSLNPKVVFKEYHFIDKETARQYARTFYSDRKPISLNRVEELIE